MDFCFFSIGGPCHQRQRVAQFPLRRYPAARDAAARGAGERADPRCPARRACRFRSPGAAGAGTTKHTAGYPLRPGMDWVDLFVGSEGTLGVIVEAEVQLLPAPGELLAGVVFFPDDETAVDAVEAWRAAAPRMLEYMDEPSLGLLRGRFRRFRGRRSAAILVEDDRELDGWLDRIGDFGRADRRRHGSPRRPPIANASACSATRCRKR